MSILGGALGFVIYDVGLFIFVVYLSKHHFNEDNEDAVRVFGFIFRKYRPSKLYWELIKICEKVALVAVAVFSSN